MEYEKLFSSVWLRKNPLNIFMLGFIFSELGIITSIILFRDNVSMMSIAFTSLMLIQPLSRMLTREANLEFRENKFSLRLIFQDHKEIFEIYFFLFLGIMLSYGVFANLMPNFQIVEIFSSQIGIPCDGSISQPRFCDDLTPFLGHAFLGKATGGLQFWPIVLNNLMVALVALVFSLAYGAGSILFLTWNASVWGTVFGYFAKVSSYAQDSLPIFAFINLMIKVLPHTITEASAYFMAVIAGGVLSKSMLKDKINKKQMKHVLFDASVFFLFSLILVFLGGILEVYVFPRIQFLF